MMVSDPKDPNYLKRPDLDQTQARSGPEKTLAADVHAGLRVSYNPSDLIPPELNMLIFTSKGPLAADFFTSMPPSEG